MSKDHDIPPQYHIAQTFGWSVNHRINSALPGYLMIASTQATNDLSDLSAEVLGLMGTVFAKVQRALNALGARRVYIGRYGHSPGYPIHFHAIPIYDTNER
ncbi:hypothetical protein SAMN05216228_11007 [Rhizobium tibeticum]|uniref:HIT domain-containing protein n=1 Tax=Rhizobium tibeticum TaxID=501024 RepID=A0ABY1AYV0_9HYPH|nr:hypothetical protein SAMN05216228_11007 [Rhizobium tibeticum]